MIVNYKNGCMTWNSAKSTSIFSAIQDAMEDLQNEGREVLSVKLNDKEMLRFCREQQEAKGWLFLFGDISIGILPDRRNKNDKKTKTEI